MSLVKQNEVLSGSLAASSAALLDVPISWSRLSSWAAVIFKLMPSRTVVQVSQWEPKLLKISRSHSQKKKKAQIIDHLNLKPVY